MASLAKLAGRSVQDKPARVFTRVFNGVLNLKPRLALAATGLILVVALIWVGFVEQP